MRQGKPTSPLSSRYQCRQADKNGLFSHAACTAAAACESRMLLMVYSCTHRSAGPPRSPVQSITYFSQAVSFQAFKHTLLNSVDRGLYIKTKDVCRVLCGGPAQETPGVTSEMTIGLIIIFPPVYQPDCSRGTVTLT